MKHLYDTIHNQQTKKIKKRLITYYLIQYIWILFRYQSNEDTNRLNDFSSNVILKRIAIKLKKCLINNSIEL